MTKLTPEQAALARDDLDKLHGKGRWVGDASSRCLRKEDYAISLLGIYRFSSLDRLIDAVDDAYGGRGVNYCCTADCARPAIPGGFYCPRHAAQFAIEQEYKAAGTPQATVTEMLTETCDIDKFLNDMVKESGAMGLPIRHVMDEIKRKVHVSMHGYAVVHILGNGWLRL